MGGVTVEAYGIGIPKTNLENVSEPFNRVRTVSTASSYGLGLSLCRRIVANHGGRMWAESDGTGTRMRFTLPA